MNMDVRTHREFPSVGVHKIRLKVLTDVEMKIRPCKNLQQEVESLEEVPAPAEKQEMPPPFF